ncbi:MAG TPA: HD domain-containing protein [Candidatus Saccharimonadales bacterium]
MADVNPSMDRLAELQQMIAEFASVQRMINIADKGRLENDVEHSFGLALTCWFMHPQIAPHLDLGKILQYALAHDIIELHAGDTFAFDTEAVKTKEAREAASLEQIKADWPDFPGLTDYAQGYADKRDAEAKFVYTIDKLLPSIMIKLSGKSEEFWHDHKITREAHEAEKRSKMRHSPEAADYLEALNEWLAKPDNFYKPE